MTPTAGEVRITGAAPALVLQATAVDASLPITVRETVALARYPNIGLLKRPSKQDREAIETAMERLNVADLADKQIHDLSGGQRQRVMVAQGLAQDTEVLLLDEPVSGLDVTSHSMILDLIDAEVAAGRTVIVTTHNLDEARRCDQVLLLKTTPVAFGSPSEVLTEENLRAAFGGHFVRIGDGFMLDDGSHHH